ncbi:hypothetical protein [Marivita hallyeonensis]|uniref:Uncharacterized protein n=1 Tax=Marivita hallyeonensis TaxID=996342 RepID=A0A1M5VP41_9RHOB|nr:hypothetical protein [Marivita hallyeonensis]SHH77051.1 hypothetical protein SAMN05443551_2988 [Marivita hallyeonensis]
MLTIRNPHTELEGHDNQALTGFDLPVEARNVLAIAAPNASLKSALTYAPINREGHEATVGDVGFAGVGDAMLMASAGATIAQNTRYRTNENHLLVHREDTSWRLS